VIGAGASGLAATRYLLSEGFQVTTYERKFDAGGVWNTTDKEYLAGLYDGLLANVPRTLMEFSDFPLAP